MLKINSKTDLFYFLVYCGGWRVRFVIDTLLDWILSCQSLFRLYGGQLLELLKNALSFFQSLTDAQRHNPSEFYLDGQAKEYTNSHLSSFFLRASELSLCLSVILLFQIVCVLFFQNVGFLNVMGGFLIFCAVVFLYDLTLEYYKLRSISCQV